LAQGPSGAPFPGRFRGQRAAAGGHPFQAGQQWHTAMGAPEHSPKRQRGSSGGPRAKHRRGHDGRRTEAEGANVVERIMQVSIKERGRVIGRQGCIIKRMRQESNASIQEVKTDIENGTTQFVISGSPDEVMVAVEMMEAAVEDRLPPDPAEDRGGDSNDEDGGAQAPAPPSPPRPPSHRSGADNHMRDDDFTRIMQVSHHARGRVIGRGGFQIKRIRQDSGASITEEKAEVENGTSQFVITGSREEVLHAVEIMEALIYNEQSKQEDRPVDSEEEQEPLHQAPLPPPSPPRPPPPMRSGPEPMQRATDSQDGHHAMQVSHHARGRVIGRGGSNIKRMRQESGASIVEVKPEVDDGTTQFVVTGTREEVGHAVQLMEAAIEDTGLPCTTEEIDEEEMAQQGPPAPRSPPLPPPRPEPPRVDDSSSDAPPIRKGKGKGKDKGGKDQSDADAGRRDDGENCEVVVVPIGLRGRIIGKGGSQIKQIRRDSGASVQERGPGQDDTEFVVTGPEDAVRAAVDIIGEILDRFVRAPDDRDEPEDAQAPIGLVEPPSPPRARPTQPSNPPRSTPQARTLRPPPMPPPPAPAAPSVPPAPTQRQGPSSSPTVVPPRQTNTPVIGAPPPVSSAPSSTRASATRPSSTERAPSASAGIRVPYLDITPDLVDGIISGRKRATCRCPGGPKDTDTTSDFHAINSQGWALATCSSINEAFAVLGIDQIEPPRRLCDLDDEVARAEGMQSGKELRRAMRRHYPQLEDADPVRVIRFRVLHAIPDPEASDSEADDVREVVRVPVEHRGRVIGKRGERIRQIRQDSGARIDEDESKNNNDEFTWFVVSGTAEAVREATRMINSTVEEFADRTDRRGR